MSHCETRWGEKGGLQTSECPPIGRKIVASGDHVRRLSHQEMISEREREEANHRGGGRQAVDQ